IPRDTDLEVREFVDTEIEDVWARYYDDELDARDFLDVEEDLAFRELLDADDYLEARADKAAKAAKKFAKDAGEYVYSNAPALINSADRKLKAAKSLNPPGPSPAQRAHEAAKKGKREFLEFDDYLEVRAEKAAKAAKKVGEHIYSNAPALINSADRKIKASKSLNPPGPSPAQRAHEAAKKGKREFLDFDDYLEVRADKAAKAAKKFAKDAGEYVYSNAPALINSADRKLKAAKSLNPPGPSPAQHAHEAAKKGKREFVDFDDYLEARADKAAKAAKKFAKDAGEYVYSNAPALINSADRKLKAAKSLNPPGPSPAQRAHEAVKKGKREFLDVDDYLEARADKAAKAAKKFAKDAGEYVYSNAPALINSADRKLKAAKSINRPGPSPAQRAHEAAKKATRKP
ncbi:hypothetical protein EST38_g14509, partial [Candolleomyces aberdarensis]